MRIQKSLLTCFSSTEVDEIWRRCPWTIDRLRSEGCRNPSVVHDLWPGWEHLWRSNLPGRRTAFDMASPNSACFPDPDSAHKASILDLFPSARVLVFEEPIDIDRVKPFYGPTVQAAPFIVWSGHFNYQADLSGCVAVMEVLYAKYPFLVQRRGLVHLAVIFGLLFHRASG